MKTRIASDIRQSKMALASPLVLILAILVVCASVVLPVLISGERRGVLGRVKARYKVGALAQEDLIARDTFYYIDESLTKDAKERASHEVLPRFVHDLEASRVVLRVLDDLGDLLLDGVQDENKYDALSRWFSGRGLASTEGICADLTSMTVPDLEHVLSITYFAVSRLLEQGIYDPNELAAVSSEGYDSLFLLNSLLDDAADGEIIEITQALALDNVERALLAMMRGSGASIDSARNIIAIELIPNIIIPNVKYDALGTKLARLESSEAVKPVTMKIDAGQYLLKKDYVITDQDVRAVQAMVLASMQYTLLQQAGRFMFASIVTGVAVWAYGVVFMHSKRRRMYASILLAGALASQIATYFVVTWRIGLDLPTYDPYLPLLALPILMSLVTNRKRAGMIASGLLASLAVLLPTATTTTPFFIVGASFFSMYFIKFVSRRMEMLFQWFAVTVATSCLVVLNHVLMGHSFDKLPNLVAAMISNVTATYILVTVTLPVLESLGKIPTAFKLRELAFGDSNMLRRLSANAQGTYNHSLVVADLAYHAAIAIGADGLLARVGALYHDIGKMDNPQYFIENQTGNNKHAELKASLSVGIIKSHVRVGVEKGREMGLPAEILDIIEQHHGNDVIAWFYKEAIDETAKNLKEPSAKPSDYSYNNPVPSSPEAAIVMLADCVEAASRTLGKPTMQRFEKLIHQVVTGKIERHQLSQSRLTLTEIEAISRSFASTLAGRYHTRIEYPENLEED